jgi:hypothetical protein
MIFSLGIPPYRLKPHRGLYRCLYRYLYISIYLMYTVTHNRLRAAKPTLCLTYMTIDAPTRPRCMSLAIPSTTARTLLRSPASVARLGMQHLGCLTAVSGFEPVFPPCTLRIRTTTRRSGEGDGHMPGGFLWDSAYRLARGPSAKRP